jgi:hypothetical protein
MNIPQKHQAELNKICDNLRQSLSARGLEECRAIISQALSRAERLSQSIASTPAKLGKQGGDKTARRGPEYFRRIAAMRKTHAGGRPKVAKPAPDA